MTKETLLNVFSAFTNQAETPMLYELVKSADNAYLEKWYLLVLSYDFKNFNVILKSLNQVLQEQAHKKAQLSKIKGYKGSRLQEIEILESYYYLQFLSELPKWFKDFTESKKA